MRTDHARHELQRLLEEGRRVVAQTRFRESGEVALSSRATSSGSTFTGFIGVELVGGVRRRSLRIFGRRISPSRAAAQTGRRIVCSRAASPSHRGIEACTLSGINAVPFFRTTVVEPQKTWPFSRTKRGVTGCNARATYEVTDGGMSSTCRLRSLALFGNGDGDDADRRSGCDPGPTLRGQFDAQTMAPSDGHLIALARVAAGFTPRRAHRSDTATGGRRCRSSSRSSRPRFGWWTRDRRTMPGSPRCSTTSSSTRDAGSGPPPSTCSSP